MANVTVTGADAQVKWFDPKRGFGFFIVEGYGDIFVHVSMLGTFQPWELVEGNSAIISFATNPDTEKLQVTHIQEVFLLYLKQQGEAFSLPRPFDYPDVPIPAAKDFLTVGETRVGVLDDIKAGFGFIKVEGVAKKVFVHFNDQMPKGLKPEVGQTFEFDVGKNDRGLLALNMTLVQVETETAPAPTTETVTAASDAPAATKRAKGPRITRMVKDPAPASDAPADAAQLAPVMAAE